MEKKNVVRFKGHESFILREGWLSKGLWAVSSNPKVFYHNFGADELGVGPNMAKSIRYWLRCGGLTDESLRNEVRLTGIGKLLLEKDPYFEDVCSLWVVHCNIARNWEQATSWELFFNQFAYEEFSKEELEREMLSMAEAAAGDKQISKRSVTDDCDAVLRMYLGGKTKDSSPEEKNRSPFGKLGLLKCLDGIYRKEQPDLAYLPKEAVWYLLLNFISENKGINIDELLTVPGGPGKILNLKRTGMVEMLERLETAGCITMNRTAGLDMVYLSKQADSSCILKNYYKQIC